MKKDKLKLDAEWKDDCQGKKDYDGNILLISTRYWGSRDYRPNGGKLTRPSAKSGLMLNYKADETSAEYDPGYEYLLEKEFEAETEDEVKQQVEEWAQEIMDKVVSLLKNEFQKPVK